MSNLSIEERITKAKIWLLTKRPWFGQLSCYLNPIENKQIPTAGVNLRGDLYYNPEWCNTLNDAQLRGLICHEILHLAFSHIPRCNDRDPLLWNIACDLKVNIEVANDNDLEFPPNPVKVNHNYNSSYKYDGGVIKNVDQSSAENIYREFRKNMKKPPTQDQDLIISTDDPQEQQELKDAGMNPVSSSESAGMSRNWQSRVYSASQQSKGDVPAGVARELFKLEHAEIAWSVILRQRMRKLAIKHSWKKPSSRYLPWYFPGRVKNEGIKIVAAVDTSGSMSKEQISKAMSELYGLMRTFKFIELWVLDCDAAVYNPKKVKMHELSKLLLSGGGGTSFKPVFEYIKKSHNDDVDCLLFFTDLYGDFPDKRPPYETFWITDTKDHSIPFGRKLVLEVDNN